MITDLEIAIAGVLTTKLAAITPAIPAHVVRTATNKNQSPGDRTMIVVRCESAPNEAAGLWKPQWQVLVISPADVKDVTVATHRALERAVQKVFEELSQSDFNNAIAAEVPGKTGGNFYAEGWTPGNEGTQWQPFFALSGGVRLAA